MSLLLAIITALVVFLGGVTVVLTIVGPTLLLRPRRRTAEFYRALGKPLTPADVGLKYEQINVSVDGGLKLHSWLIKSPTPSKGTVIYLHGVGDCKIDGIRFAKLLHDNHYNVFLYDARRHGESEGQYCTYGYFEKHDVRRIIDYLETRTDFTLGKVGIFGTSMGAAVAIQAAALDKRIVAVVAENSFATLRTIFDDYQKRMIKLPFHYLRNLVIKRSEWLAKFKANDVSPLDSVRNVHIPLLFIYGKNDHLIDYKYSLMLYENTDEPKELFPIENAKHNDTWDVAGDVYAQKIISFFEKALR
jgi:pimeloyl-ACP methyl ester carboxylesterase